MRIDMPSISLYRIGNKIPYIDITNLCESLTLSADITQCARKCELTLAYPLNDHNHEKVFPAKGDIVTVKLKSKVIFLGMIMARGMSSDETVTFTCYDQLIHILKSKGTFNFKNTNAKKVAQQIASEVGLKIGYIYPSSQSISFIAKDKSFYEVIMMAYTMVSDTNGSHFIPIMANGNQFNIIEKGHLATNIALNVESNITTWEYTDTIEDMVNRVKIYDDDGKYLGCIENQSWINSFGLFQGVVNQEDGKDPNYEARKALQGPTQTFSLECIGIPECITGYGVRVQIKHLDLVKNQDMFIDGDTHTFDFSSSTYTMNLQLSFTNNMDRQEVDDE